jgi:RNA polymerase sigma-70 factor (ECF subfamily)
MPRMSPQPVPIAELLAHAEFVRGLARDLVRDAHLRDDLAQEAWLQTLRRPPRHGAALRGWFASLVHSLFVNHRRGERRRQLREAAVEPPPPPDTAADVAAQEQVRQQLLAAVMRLDEPFRTAVLLRYYEELTPAQIARRLAVPAATVRTRVARGLERLREQFDREHGDDRAAWVLPLCAWPGVHPFDPTPLAALLAMKKSIVVAAAALLAAAAVMLSIQSWPATPAGAPGATEAAAVPGVATASPPAGAPVAPPAGEQAASERTLAGTPDGAAGADDEPMGELLIRVTWADDSPAPGVNVHVATAYPGAVPRARLVTDAAGQAHTRVAAGKTRVACDRASQDALHPGRETEVDVVAGKQHEVTLKIAPGVDVAGIVRDGSGAPVAGARIWLTCFTQPWCAMAQVTESDAHGAFTVRAAPKEQSLGATAPGKAPSQLVDLETCDVKQSPVHIELVLDAIGGAMTGRVVDEQGNGVAGARIAVGQNGRLVDHGVDGRMQERWAPRQAVTDATGAYVLDGMPPGKHPVEVWAAAFPFWHGDTSITAGEATRLDVTLLRPVTVRGVVTGADGAPLAGAIVRVFPRSIDETFLMGGQYDYDSTFGFPFAVVDAQGRYRVLRVAPGELQLYASVPPGGRGSEAIPWAHDVMQAQPGAVVEWNPKVEPGPTIAGVVRYRDGTPMPRVFVNVVEPGNQRGQAIVADEQGRFRFVRLQRKAYDVTVQVWDPPQGAPPLEARDVWPDRGVLELIAAYDAPVKLASGSVTGVIDDAAGRAANPAAIRVVLVNDDRSWHPRPALQDGRFTFKDVEPGKKQVILMADEAPIHVGPSFELHPAERKDLGTITTEPGGKLTLRIVRSPGTEEMEPTLYLRPAGSMDARKVAVGRATELTLDNLCLGENVVSGWNEGIARIEAKCVVTAGEPAALTIALRAAVSRDLVVEFGPDQKVMRVRVEDDRGNEVWEIAADRVGLTERPFRRKANLPLGKFTLRVETAGGGVSQVEFTMTSLDKNQPPIVITAK